MDSALVEQADITAANALETYLQAEQYKLTGLQEKSTQSLLRLLPQVELPAADRDGAD